MKPRLVKKGEHEKGFCKVCKTRLQGRQTSYCSQECWYRNTPSIMRRMVEKRDKGVCALCGCQCKHRWMSHKTYTDQQIRSMPRWQADHIIPVAEGGGLCGLDNYRTLCTTCHKKVTNELRKRLKESRNVQEKPAP